MSWFYWLCWSLVRALGWLLWGLKPIDADNIPRTGPMILAANHQSYLDPPLIAVTIPREMHFFAKKELFDIFILGRVITWLNSIPVRRGTYDPKSLNRAFEALSNSGALIMFPEGTRGNGTEFLKPKPGIGMIAKRTRAAIVPAFAHRTHRLKEAMFWRGRMKIVFGRPIPADELDRFADDKDGYLALAEYVMEHIAELKANTMGISKRDQARPETE